MLVWMANFELFDMHRSSDSYGENVARSYEESEGHGNRWRWWSAEGVPENRYFPYHAVYPRLYVSHTYYMKCHYSYRLV